MDLRVAVLLVFTFLGFSMYTIFAWRSATVEDRIRGLHSEEETPYAIFGVSLLGTIAYVQLLSFMGAVCVGCFLFIFGALLGSIQQLSRAPFKPWDILFPLLATVVFGACAFFAVSAGRFLSIATAVIPASVVSFTVMGALLTAKGRLTPWTFTSAFAGTAFASMSWLLGFVAVTHLGWFAMPKEAARLLLTVAIVAAGVFVVLALTRGIERDHLEQGTCWSERLRTQLVTGMAMMLLVLALCLSYALTQWGLQIA